MWKWVCAALTLWAALPPGAPAEEKAKILLIATAPDHDWNTHMYSQEVELLAKCLRQTPGVEAAVSPQLDWPADPGVLEGVDAIVFYSRPAGDIILAPERREQVRRLLENRVGFVAIHWATGTQSAKYGPEYLDLLGGWFHFDHSGLKVGTQPLEQARPDHPVCRGWESYDLKDEIYLNLKFHPRATPVLKVAVDGKEQVVAWAHEREGGGRSFGTTLGHFHDNFRIPAFRKALVNGILWAANVEVPAGGAPAEAGPDDLKLPPPPKK